MTFVDLFKADPVLATRITAMHGWETVGGSVFRPQGVLIHHTAGSIHGGPTASLNVVADGRPGIPPPLCNLYVSRTGGLFIISANKANHAGKCSSVALAEVAAGHVSATAKNAAERGLRDDTVGNMSLYGIEVENDGTGHEPWPDVVVETTARAAAVLCRANHWTVGHISEHRKITARKTDPVGRVDWWAKTQAFLTVPTTPVHDLLLLPDGRIVSWDGSMANGARQVSHVQSIGTVQRLLAEGWTQHPFNGTVNVTREIP